MQIHTVRRNDTLWNLSRQYQVPLEQIIAANGISEQDSLIIGQSIIIPTTQSGTTHQVAPGETMWSIARAYGMTLQELIAANPNINPAQLTIGQTIQIPQPNRPTIEVNTYTERFNEEGIQLFNEIAANLTYIGIFSYHVNPDGTLVPIPAEQLINAAIAQSVTPMMVITNIQEGGFSSDLVHVVLSDITIRTNLIENIVNIMLEKGFFALNVDFEYVPQADRELYNQFLRELTARLHEYNFLVSSCLAPKYSADQPGRLYEAHDYRAHGEILDFVILMTYEWGWSGGPPRAVAPLNEVTRVVNYALTEIPPEKIMLGMPLYGYDWTLPFNAGVDRARTISPDLAIEIARKQQAEIMYDQTAQSPHFTYYDENGRQHEVWFEDARSVQAKFNLVKQYGLRGVSYWVLGLSFPQNWYLIRENFNVRKLL